MGYARRDVDETKKYAKKFVRYPEGAEKSALDLQSFRNWQKKQRQCIRWTVSL